MMKKLLNFKNAILSLCISACCCNINVQAQDLIWASRLASSTTGGQNNSPSIWTNSGKHLTVDHEGNTYTTAWFDPDTVTVTTTASSNSAQFIRTIFTSSNRDGYLVKYDTAGEIKWTKQIGGPYGDGTYSVVVDQASNVYITGGFNDVVDFNPGGTGGIVTAPGRNNDIYIAKYNKDGNFIWVKYFGNKASESGAVIRLDTLGNLYLCGGILSDTIDFNPNGTGGLLTPGYNSTVKAYIAKFDTAGNYKWATVIGGANAVYGGYNGNFAVSQSGEIYLSGYIMFGPVVFGTGQNAVTVTPTGGGILPSEGFVAKYNTNGDIEWVHTTQGARIRGIAVDYEGNPIFTGSFTGTTAAPFDLNFGTGSALFTSVGGSGSDIFVAKYKSDGTYVWAKNMGGTSGDAGEDVAVDKGNNIYVLSSFQGTANFNLDGNGSDTLKSPASNDLAISKHTPNGGFFWVRGITSPNAVAIGAIDVTNRGRVSVTGTFGRNLGISPGLDTLFNRAVTPGNEAFVINLSCNDTTASFLAETLECGAPYTLNDETYTAAGTYVQHRPNTAGCDSVITFELIYTELNPEITIDVDTLSTIESYNSYQWIKDGNLIAGATNAKLTVSENGDYQVIVTNQYGCSDTSEVYPVTNQSSVNDINSVGQQVKVFPNPANEVIYIKSPVSINIALTGIDGRTLISKENAVSLSVKGWANGIYFLRITDKEGRLIRVEKIVKE